MTARVVSVSPHDNLATARERLRVNRIHHLLVMEDGSVVGLLSYRDLIGKDDKLPVEQVMARDVVTIEPWDSVRNAAAKMIGRTHGCLPVVAHGEVTGIITTTDLLRAVSHEPVKPPVRINP